MPRTHDWCRPCRSWLRIWPRRTAERLLREADRSALPGAPGGEGLGKPGHHDDATSEFREAIRPAVGRRQREVRRHVSGRKLNPRCAAIGSQQVREGRSQRRHQRAGLAPRIHRNPPSRRMPRHPSSFYAQVRTPSGTLVANSTCRCPTVQKCGSCSLSPCLSPCSLLRGLQQESESATPRPAAPRHRAVRRHWGPRSSTRRSARATYWAYGSTTPCFLFEDCNGTGYVWVAARQLRSQGSHGDGRQPRYSRRGDQPHVPGPRRRRTAASSAAT